MVRSLPDIIEFITDPQLLGLSLSAAQETLLRGMYGLPLISDEQRLLWRECTGLEVYPGHLFRQVTIIAGAKSGKDSRIVAPVVCYEALFGGHEAQLAKGEKAAIAVVTPDVRATEMVFSYIRGYLTTSPLLASELTNIRAFEIQLINGISIICFHCTSRALQGWSVPIGVMNEVASFCNEGRSDADVALQASLRRGMVTFPAPRLVKVSTPHTNTGVLWNDFKNGWGRDNPDLLVWRAPSVLMNPNLPAEHLDWERRDDPGRFARQYAAEFLDLSSLDANDDVFEVDIEGEIFRFRGDISKFFVRSLQQAHERIRRGERPGLTWRDVVDDPYFKLRPQSEQERIVQELGGWEYIHTEQERQRRLFLALNEYSAWSAQKFGRTRRHTS